MNFLRAPLAALFFCGLLAPSHAAAFKLCYPDADNFPWHIKGSKGLSNILVDMAASKAGVEVEQLPLPWKRCLGNVADGSIPGAFAASFTEERAAFAVYPTTAGSKLDLTRRIKTETYSLYRLKGVKANWNGKAFSNLTGPVGAQLGYSVIADLKKAGVEPIEVGTAAESYMRGLLQGQIQLAALLTLEGDDLLKRPEYAERIERIRTPFSERDYFVIFGKDYYAKNKKQIEDFWRGLARARDSEEFRKLLADKNATVK